MDRDNPVAPHGKKIKRNAWKTWPLFIFLLPAACSKINSVEPFDQRQAAILLQQNYVANVTQQMIAIRLPSHSAWKTIDKSHGILGSRVMLVPQNESGNEWTQSIHTKISGYINTPNMTASAFTQDEIKAARNACSEVSIASFVETSAYVFYALDKSGCGNIHAEKQIAKAFQGKDAIYFVSYTAKKETVSPQEINKMSRAIETATLVNNPRYNVTAT